MTQLHLLSPRGFTAAGIHAGIRTASTAPDVGLLVCDVAAAAAAVFTTNQVVAAPVKLGRKIIAAGSLRGVVVNSGNANACTGCQGERDALRMCELAARAVGAQPRQFLPSSTGIIGHMLPMDRIEQGIAAAARSLGSGREHALAFASAIMTTDTKRKEAAVSFRLGRSQVVLAGVCKGSGMIGPRMALPHATMLAYLTTDARIAPALLRRLLAQAVEGTFNAVTVDNHASTNDTACIMASGLSDARIDSPAAARAMASAMREVCAALAYQIAADGEGATKVVVITVKGARSDAEARLMARAVADSPLVKCAMHGNDPNWGRIVSAAGLTSARFDPGRATLRLQGTKVFARGRPLAFDRRAVSKALAAKEVSVELACGLGSGSATVWTCDLSKEYVSINAEYHT